MAPVPTQKTFSAGSEFPPTTPGRLRIYSMRFCPYAQRARLVLAHKNIEHETVNVDLKNKPDWFLARNPFGLVPTLEIDDKVVYESSAAADWLDEAYPGNKLTPDDPYRKARDRMLFEYFGKVTTCFYSILRQSDDKEKNVEDLRNKHFKYYEDAIAERGTRFFGGDKPAMIDFLLWPHTERLLLAGKIWDPRVAITAENFPSLWAWKRAMVEVPAVKATMFDDDTHRNFFETVKTGKPDYDYKLRE